MEGTEQQNVYEWLMREARTSGCTGFDAHVLASVLALTAVESEGEGAAWLCGIGLTREELLAVAGEFFPGVIELLQRTIPEGEEPACAPDEACLRELLARSSNEGSRFEQCLAKIVARRCQRPNHLWQDLGLRNRRELSWLMERHFAYVARRNARDMKWKKFLYRTICRDEGMGICTAPSCSECGDFDNCFGDESGESLLARARRDQERSESDSDLKSRVA